MHPGVVRALRNGALAIAPEVFQLLTHRIEGNTDPALKIISCCAQVDHLLSMSLYHLKQLAYQLVIRNVSFARLDVGFHVASEQATLTQGGLTCCLDARVKRGDCLSKRS